MYKGEEYYKIVGICMDVHTTLGGGLSEVIYKDALEFEFKENGIPFEREKQYAVYYKGKQLGHHFYADFVLHNEIILEVKAGAGIVDNHISQTINYMKLANSKIGVIVNFNIRSLFHKRVVL